MKKEIVAVLLSAMLVFVLINLAGAISGEIGNARAVLYPKVGFFGATIERTILVKNPNDVAVNVTIKALDENSSKMIDIADKEFSLEAGQETNAKFTIKIKKEGDYDLKLGVMYAPLNGKGAGVALTAEYIIHASKSGADSGEDSSDGDSSNANEAADSQDSAKKNKSETPINPGVIIVGASTSVLAVILIALLVLLKKKKGKENKKRSKREKKIRKEVIGRYE